MFSLSGLRLGSHRDNPITPAYFRTSLLQGVERMNVIEENLVAITMRSSAMLRSDSTGPSNFWAATPFNFWRHNVGAGSESANFWFELPGNPNGPSFNPDTCPVHHQLGEFLNNTGHSSTFGLRIYPVWHPLKKQCGRTDLLSDPEPAMLYNSTFHHVSSRGIFWKRSGSIHMNGFAFVENALYDVRVFFLDVPPQVRKGLLFDIQVAPAQRDVEMGM